MKIINYIKELDLFRLFYLRLRFKQFLIIPFKNTYLRINKSNQVTGIGRLLLGKQWESGRFMPSQMILRSDSRLILNGDFIIYSGHNIWINQNASLTLGSGYINNNFNLSCFDSIEIGHNVAISENVTIRDSDDHCIGVNNKTKPIKIGNNVWIGINVTILKGVSIGDGAVIAAGSLVNRDVPPKTLVAGVPAVVQKQELEWHSLV